MKTTNYKEINCRGTRLRHLLLALLPLIFAASLVSCGSSGGENSSNSISSSNGSAEEIHSSTDSGLQNLLVGIWTSDGYRLIFKPDNMYSRDFSHDDIPAVLGSATASGNVVIVTDDSGGHSSCVNSVTGQVTSGSYTYAISGNTLTFNRFHDPCSGRAAFFSLVYTRQ